MSEATLASLCTCGSPLDPLWEDLVTVGLEALDTLGVGTLTESLRTVLGKELSPAV